MLVGLMCVRNEDWCLGLTLRAAAQWCDLVVVLLHACTDLSQEIAMQVASEEPGKIIVVSDDRPLWDEMRHRQAMLEIARTYDATHIAMIDADEILTADQTARIRMLIQHMPADACMQLPGYNLRHGREKYHANGIWGLRWFSFAFRDRPDLMWEGDRFHHREPHGGRPLMPYRPIAQHHGGVMHLWGISERRLAAKHALYKLTERLRWPDRKVSDIEEMYGWWKHDRPPVTPAQWSFVSVPPTWWDGYRDLLCYLCPQRTPWQEAECRRIVEDHPGIEQGLDLFGVL